MKHPDAFDSAVVSWVEDATHSPVPAAPLERALAAVSSRQPRPARIAALGSHWVDGPSRGAAPLGVSLGLSFLGARSAFLVLLIVLTLIGAAAFFGSLQVQPRLTPERLVYDVNGDIYLADATGGNPVRVASGVLASEAIWAPDGRHFLFLHDGAHIADADGQVVSSFELSGFNGYPTWSPDSTRLQAWTHRFTRISIYDIDGVVQSELRLPAGYARLRENLGLWAPDGRSVRVQITRETAPGLDPGETWELPVDGSTPRRIVEHLALMGGSHVSFAPDGTRMAFSGRDLEPTDWVLYVANPDGTALRRLVRVDNDANHGEGMLPVWSPDGEQVAYVARVFGSDVRVRVNVVDLATGTARTLLADFAPADWSPHRWSADGSRLLASGAWGSAAGGLWSISTDGGPATLLVEGALTGEWQRAPPGR